MKKVGIILMLIPFLLIILTKNLYAATENVTVKVDKTQVKPNDTLTLIISANSNGEDSIDGISSKISYSKSVFELVSSELIDNENWSELDTFPNLIAIWKTSTKEVSSADIYKVTFRVKEGVTPQEVLIILTDITLSTTGGQITVNDLVGNIHIVEETEDKDNNEDNDNNDNNKEENDKTQEQDKDQDQGQDQEQDKDKEQEDSSNKEDDHEENKEDEDINNQKQESDEEKKEEEKKVENTEIKKETTKQVQDTSTSKKEIPFTGNIMNFILIILSVIFTLTGIISYILYKRYRKV